MSRIASWWTYFMLVFVGNVWSELSVCVSLGLENPLEGNTGNQEQLCLFSLPSFVWNYYLINILNTRLYWNWSEWIVSVSLGKFSWNSRVLFFQKSLHKQSFEEFAVKIFRSLTMVCNFILRASSKLHVFICIKTFYSVCEWYILLYRCHMTDSLLCHNSCGLYHFWLCFHETLIIL